MRKVTCPRCKHFIGMIADDGSGPIFDDCVADGSADRRECPMRDAMEQFQPKRIPLGLGGGRSGPMEDESPWQANAIRCMEEA